MYLKSAEIHRSGSIVTSPLSGKESNQSFPYPTLRSARLCGKETRNPRETESWEKTDSIDISLFHIHAYLWWWVLPPLLPFLLSLRVQSLLVSKVVVLSTGREKVSLFSREKKLRVLISHFVWVVGPSGFGLGQDPAIMGWLAIFLSSHTSWG